MNRPDAAADVEHGPILDAVSYERGEELALVSPEAATPIGGEILGDIASAEPPFEVGSATGVHAP